ncbi:MAG: transcriptional repressor [Clostridia bacterium]|nr:transcriptional repressor [Clostridia bacterium]
MQERQTKQKAIIYDALKTLNHPTATEVYGYVHKTAPTVSRATVFRVLGGFAASGKAIELRKAGAEVRYDYNVEPHIHARCTECGQLSDVWVTLPEFDGGINDEGFFLEGYTLEFYGKCLECRSESKRS